MSGTSSTTSFFSFGTNDSFLSRSFAGLKYRNLPATLRDLLGSTVSEVHWASLGPVADSWILSFKDSSGKNTLRWGSSTPQRLQAILAKTWHSPHLRAFLGPYDSFIIWHPELIRWANLPTSLEDVLQSWLTPSGWKVGPPRMVTWGPQGAFFAMSEYGNVVYRLGDGDAWEIYKETVEEWKVEKGFLWSDLAFIALDPTSSDQFIAIRNDGTWAGSIEDTNEDALESFALNFFAKAKRKSKASASQENGQPPAAVPTAHTKPDAATQALYEKWSKETATALASASAATGGSKPKAPRKLQVRSQSSASDASSIPPRPVTSAKLLTSFPYLPSRITTCALTTCSILKSEPDGIQACQHDVERLLRASGLYSYEWLRQERLRWHPDRFGRLCEESWREAGKKMAGEMFKLMSVLIEELRAAEGRERNEGVA
ncbi:Nn.00g024130.m01.CDS01 [Neocucurbitaria sp. VM-36]